MQKLIVIAGAVAILAMVGHTVIEGEHAPPTAAAASLMPSPLQLMSGATDLQDTPFVAP